MSMVIFISTIILTVGVVLLGRLSILMSESERVAHTLAADLRFAQIWSNPPIRVGKEESATASDYELLAGAVAAGENITIRVPIPVETRYVLVWLTNLPYQEGTYIGGVREVQVLG